MSLIVLVIINTTVNIHQIISTNANKIMKMDCLPVFWTILFDTVTPKTTPKHVQNASQKAYGRLVSPAIVNEIKLAAAAYITINIEVEDATKGGYPIINNIGR